MAINKWYKQRNLAQVVRPTKIESFPILKLIHGPKSAKVNNRFFWSNADFEFRRIVMFDNRLKECLSPKNDQQIQNQKS